MSMYLKNTLSKEVDIEISDYFSDSNVKSEVSKLLKSSMTNSTNSSALVNSISGSSNGGCSSSPSEITSNYSTTTAELTTKSTVKNIQLEDLPVNSESFSFYDTINRKSLTNENTSSDSSESYSISLKNTRAQTRKKSCNSIDYTGDKADKLTNGKSSEKIISDEKVLDFSKLRKEIIGSNLLNDNINKLLDKKIVQKNQQSSSGRKHKSRNQSIQQFKEKLVKDYDKDSVTLMIKVPRKKLIDQFIKRSNSISTESKHDVSYSSLESNDEDSSTISASSTNSRIKDEVEAYVNSNIVSDNEISSNISTILDRSKHIIKSYNKSIDKNHIQSVDYLIPKNQETQTNSGNISATNYNLQYNKSYFLCNICRKIVPSTLSPVCQRLTCSAIENCSQIFHCELDMVMHLPVKHELEFSTYEICQKCHRMYHPTQCLDFNEELICIDCYNEQN